jgi:endoglucanase
MNRREIVLGAAALAACAPEARSQAATPFPMRRGVNLGNALEAPNEGDWGYRIEPAHLNAIRAAGFDGVRLPVRWDQHIVAGRVAPAHMERVAEVARWALQRGLQLQLNVHHYEQLIAEPRTETARFLSLWRQIAERFADAAPELIFEVLNEPNGAHWDGQRLTDLQALALETIRGTNPERLVVLGPGNWQNIDALRNWRPTEAENMTVSVHYYEPHAFTHQRAPWLGDNAPRFERDWGTDADRAAVREHIRSAADWGAAHGYAIQLGEFGVNAAVDMGQRVAWTRAVREACDAEGLGWCVWDLAGAFTIMDRHEGSLLHDLHLALFDQ